MGLSGSENLSALNDPNRHDNITSFNDLSSLFGLKKLKLLALYILSDFPGIRNLSSLNDLNSLNNLSGLLSLISSKNLLRLIFVSTLAQKLSWSLNVEWIIKNPLFY
jgi:hypothetical protein